MRKLILAGFMLIIFSGISCTSKTEKKPTMAASTGNDIEVYYFHMTIRCTTCQAIEAEARKDLGLLYPEQVKSGKISFVALNLEEATGKAAGERLGVNSQSLMIVKGDQKINLTNEGFLYAVSKPDKFQEIIKEKVDLLIK